jgi:hypothetical protein
VSTLVYKAKWRPVRVGWCICDGDLDALITGFRLNHCLWGGRFNPVIVIDDEPTARRLIELFHVDVLLPLGGDQRSITFVKAIKHLPSPFFHKELFEDRGDRKDCVLLDIYHPARAFFEQNVKDKSAPTRNTTLYRWNDTDPLAATFEATFGCYPLEQPPTPAYRDFVVRYTAATETEITLDGTVGAGAIRAVTANTLTTLGLRPELGEEYYESGLFVGHADSFSHLVEFWNLRATNIDLFFLDPRFAGRLRSVVEDLDQFILSLPAHPRLGPRRLGVWQMPTISSDDLPHFGSPVTTREVNACTWDDRVWKGLKVNPPIMKFEEYTIVGQISGVEIRPTVTLQLGDKPGYCESPFRQQHLMLTLKPTLNYSRNDRFLFQVPFIPELNEYFGRQHHFIWNEARADKDGIGIITPLWTDFITLTGMERFSFARELFKAFGISAEVSAPGLICDQLIRQMGGLQGCRVFKIKGVRKLIEQFRPTQSFKRSAAIQMIRNVDPTTSQPDFADYEHLYLEPREKERLKPEDAFTYLLKRGVFRVGLELKCPSCKLDFWRSLDDVKALLDCEYCGREFDTAPLLRDRDWAYRASGLFGRGDRQEGGLPVALTLQQLETTLHSDFVIWLPAIRLEPASAAIDKCETDFVVLCQDWHGRVKLVIGECKTNQQITDDDVRNLSKVADALSGERFDVFIVFSKAGTFEPEEIERCRAADSLSCRRTILLSERELEPYSVYERAAQEFAIDRTAVSLEDMVEATRGIYFEPRPRSV